MKPVLQLQARAWRDRLRALQNLPPVIALLWNSSPSLVAESVTLRLATALIPVSALWISKLIIDAVVAAAKGAPAPALHIWILLGAEFLLACAATVMGRTVDYC